ncbi:g3390 [Coccomyxa elongata]
MLNGVKVTSANLNKLAQQTPVTPSASSKTALSTPAATTATSTPALVTVHTSGAAMVNSAVSNQGTLGSGMFSSIQGGQATSTAGQFVQAAPVSAGMTRSAGTAGGSGGSGGGARLAGSVTSVAGGRKLLVRPLHIVVS